MESFLIFSKIPLHLGQRRRRLVLYRWNFQSPLDEHLTCCPCTCPRRHWVRLFSHTHGSSSLRRARFRQFKTSFCVILSIKAQLLIHTIQATKAPVPKCPIRHCDQVWQRRSLCVSSFWYKLNSLQVCTVVRNLFAHQSLMLPKKINAWSCKYQSKKCSTVRDPNNDV